MKESNQEKKRREKCHLSGIVLIALQWEKHNAVGRWGKGRRTTQATDKLRCAKNGTTSFSSKCPRANPVEKWNSKQVCDTHGVVGNEHRLLHTQVRTSVPPLYPWLWFNAHIRCHHSCRKRGGKGERRPVGIHPPPLDGYTVQHLLGDFRECNTQRKTRPQVGV